MLVSELRELLKKYTVEDLRLLVSEMYKSMPKKLREDKDIDELLKDVQAYARIGKAEKTQGKQINIEEIKPQIELFIEYAYKQYYFAPNNYIHKKDRPKWRFIVKAYIKDLQDVRAEGTEGETATVLLTKLYEMLSYGCAYYIFNTDNPFRSVGIEQTDLLDSIIKRKLANGIGKECVRSAISLVINSNVDRETLTSSLINVLLANLKSTDSKELAIEQCMAVKEELEGQKPNSSRKSSSSNFSEYYHKEKINNLVEMLFKLYMALCEYDKAIAYFNRNNMERDKEVALYVLLSHLFNYDLKEHWLNEYDRALKNGVEPREALKRTFMYIRKNNKLPEYMHM
jgi:hypothetical protein